MKKHQGVAWGGLLRAGITLAVVGMAVVWGLKWEERRAQRKEPRVTTPARETQDVSFLHPPPTGPRKPDSGGSKNVVSAPSDGADLSDREWGMLEARSIAFEYHTGKQNIFFKKNEFIHDILDRDPEAISHLTNFLTDDRELDVLPEDSNFMESKPSILLDRMAAIDVLEALASEESLGRAAQQAQDALVDLLDRPLDHPSKVSVKRIRLAEKYDALTALVHLNTPRAFELYANIQQDALAEALKPALMAGLIDKGVPRSEVGNMVAGLRKGEGGSSKIDQP